MAPALVKAQAAMKPVVKDAINPHFKTKYASLDAITTAALEALTANGIALLQGGGEGTQDDAGMEVVTRLLHTSGQWIESGLRLPLAKSDPQGAGSATTYGRRYCLAAMLGIVADEDDDATAAIPRPMAAPASTPAPRKASPAPEKASATSTIPAACTTCGGPVWDNRNDKANPKAPDWKCKDKECRDEKGYVTGGWAALAAAPAPTPPNFDEFPAALRDEEDSDAPY
jgi:hypothetical protein